MLIRKEETESETKLCSDSEYRQRSSDLNPEEAEEVYDKPSLETAKWSVYWDPDQADWYFYNKISGKLYSRICLASFLLLKGKVRGNTHHC